MSSTYDNDAIEEEGKDNESVFFLDGDEKIEYDVSVYNKNYIEQNRLTHQKWFKITVAIVASLAAVSILTYLVLLSFLSPVSLNNKSSNDKSFSMPMFEAMGKPDPVKYGHVNIKVSKNTISASDGNSLALKNASLTSAQSDTCQIADPQSFCLVAQGEFKGEKIDVYYFKDIAGSLFFNSPSAFKQVEGVKGRIVALSDISFKGENRTVVATGEKNSSGFMILTPKNSSVDFVKDLASSLN